MKKCNIFPSLKLFSFHHSTNQNNLLPKHNTNEKVAVLSKWSFINQWITVKQQFTSASVNWWITVKWQFTSVNWWITVKQQFTSVNWHFTSCKPPLYKCKLAVYTCEVLNSRFTTVLLITLLDTVEVTSSFQFFFGKAVVYMCKPVVYRCKLLLYCKPPLYKL